MAQHRERIAGMNQPLAFGDCEFGSSLKVRMNFHCGSAYPLAMYQEVNRCGSDSLLFIREVLFQRLQKFPVKVPQFPKLQKKRLRGSHAFQ
jgi:hypothetical protein